MKERAAGAREIGYRISEGTLIIDLKRLHRTISSAPRGGGIVRARSILNHQVPANPVGFHSPAQGRWSHPARHLGRLAVRLKARRPVVGLMTAVPMKQLVIGREQSGSIWIECFCTVGVTNAVRAGEFPPRSGSDRTETGTINIILITNATLATAALVGAVQVATESKTGTLIENNVRSVARKASLATGTGTDAVVIASSLEGLHRIAYSGTHTVMGAMIGRLVSRCVQAGLMRSLHWSQAVERRTSRAGGSS